MIYCKQTVCPIRLVMIRRVQNLFYFLLQVLESHHAVSGTLLEHLSIHFKILLTWPALGPGLGATFICGELVSGCWHALGHTWQKRAGGSFYRTLLLLYMKINVIGWKMAKITISQWQMGKADKKQSNLFMFLLATVSSVFMSSSLQLLYERKMVRMKQKIVSNRLWLLLS